MPFPSRLDGSRHSKLNSARWLACMLNALLAPALLLATPSSDAAEPPTIPVTEAPKQELAKDSKKPQKYDIEHIGQRGIGRGFNLYSVKHELELGRNMAAGFDRSTRAIHDNEVNAYVNRLAQKIVRYSDAEIPFTVKVIDSGDVPRAYGLPGGFLYVDSALILSADDEAELAAVMAHEIAHVAARHATRAMTRRDVCRIIDSIAYVAGPAGAGAADIGGLAGPLSVKKFSRDAEYELTFSPLSMPMLPATIRKHCWTLSKNCTPLKSTKNLRWLRSPDTTSPQRSRSTPRSQKALPITR